MLQMWDLLLHISEFNMHLAKIEVLTAVLLKVLGLLDPEDEGTLAVRNVSNHDGLATQKDFALLIVC
jgi:hypothetical protein